MPGRQQPGVARDLVDDLLTDPRTARQDYEHKVQGPVSDYRLPDKAAQWGADGRFVGLLEP